LAGIDPQASTIQLSNVYSMGTETRRPPNQFIAPVQEPYGYIIFRASEVKDLSVDELPPAQSQHNVHDDPAVLGASAPSSYLPPGGVNNAPNAPPLNQPPSNYVTQQQQTPTTAPAIQQLQPQTSQPQTASVTPTPQPGNQIAPTRRANPVNSAAASLETVERALGDLRVNGGGPANMTHPNRGGRRSHPRGARPNDVEQITVPATDFDFQSSNAKFEKEARSPVPPKDDSTNGDTSGKNNNNSNNSERQQGDKDQVGLAYNRSTSFFDSLSSSADAPAPGVSGGHNGSGRGRRGGGNMGRNRREEERERNVATFGEPGGVGLLGPGGYVGGWGGYGRRGGRPRRGGPRGGGHPVPSQ